MRKLIPIILIFLTFSLLEFGQQKRIGKKPKIGLLTFSVNAFDEESKKINAGLKALKGIIDKELKKRFQIAEKTSDEITYSDIELPEVTIDPVVEPETNKKLEQLCKQDWDGLVFGHFHQEDKLIVVTRFYLSKKKYPGIKKDERIISSPEIEIPTTNLSKKSLETYTAQSIQELIEAIKTKRPEVFGLAEDSKPQKGQNDERKLKKKAPTLQEIKKSQKERIKYKVEALTIKDAYQMVIDNGFYCEIVMGTKHHDEVFEKISKPKKLVFPLKRKVTAKMISEECIETDSKINFQSNKLADQNIKLSWYKYNQKRYYSFDEAKNIVKKMANSKRESKKWRLPTLKELLSIVESDKNHFPWAFDFPKNQDIIVWTSTAVEKKGTALDYDKKNKAYFVVRSVYNKKTNNYTLSFAHQNIGGKKKRKAYILPVASDKVYKHKTVIPKDNIPGFDGGTNNSNSSVSDKIPGFDSTGNKSVPSTPPKSENSKKSDTIPQKPKTPDRIPGFDDIPEPSKRKSPKTISSRSNNSKRYLPKNRVKLNILLFPVVDDEKMKNRRGLVVPTQFNESVKLTLEELKEELIKNCELKISEINQSYLYIIEQFYRIILNKRISRDRKLFEITDKIIVPPTFTDIDIVVAGTCSNLGGIYVSSTFLIDLINYDIPVIHSGGSSDFWEHKEFIKRKINEIVKNRHPRIIKKKLKTASEIE